jgi:lysophospholipase L1-like esterase
MQSAVVIWRRGVGAGRLLVWLALAAALTVALFALAIPATASAAGRYVAMGDSISVGFSATTGHGFVSLYYNWLASHRGVDQLLNRAIYGEDSSEMVRDQLPLALADINDPATDTKVVTIEIGINSGSCESWNTNDCPFAANLASTLDQLNAALANDPNGGTVQVEEYPNAAPNGGHDQAWWANWLLGTDHVIDCGGRGLQLGLNDLAACIAVRHHAIPVNMYPAFRGHPEYTADGVHPTNAGHAVMAGLFETTTTTGGLVAGLPPTMTVGTPTVQDTQATVSAAINPNGRSTVWRVQYGTTTSYESQTPAETLSAADVEQPVTAMLTGLRPATSYHYRFVANNRTGSGSITEDHTFTTSDQTPPTTTVSLDPSSPNGTNDWYASPVGVSVSAKDSGSGVAQTRCVFDPATPPTSFDQLPNNSCSLTGVSGDGQHTIYAASIDTAGNKETPVAVSFSIDQTPPTTMVSLDPSSPNGTNGWYTSLNNVSVSADDGSGSGVAQTRCVFDPATPPTSFDQLPNSCSLSGFAGDGQHTIYAASIDTAGNKQTPVSVSYKVDQTPPTLAPTLSSTTIRRNQTGVTAAQNASDSTSGIASSSCNSIDTGTAGDHTVTCQATDNAGHSNSATIHYTVALPAPVINVPGMLTIKASPSGAVVDYTVSATDGAGRPLTAKCAPPSGSTFPIGSTIVKCSATDSFGNVGERSFEVVVTQAAAGAPRLSAFKLAPRSFRPAPGGSSLLTHGKAGSKVSYRISVPATVMFTIEQTLTGRQQGRRCVPSTPARHKLPRCTRYVMLSGSFNHGSNAGRNSFQFTGRFNGKTLKPGTYWLIAIARGSAGKTSRPVRLPFTTRGQHSTGSAGNLQP